MSGCCSWVLDVSGVVFDGASPPVFVGTVAAGLSDSDPSSAGVSVRSWEAAAANGTKLGRR